MALKMEVYTPKLELRGILEVHSTVIWEDKAFTAGTFSVSSLITTQSLELLKEDYLLLIEGDTAGIIEHIEQSADDGGQHITAKGRLLVGILDRRILWGQYNLYGKPSALMRELVYDSAISPSRGDNIAARIIPNFALATTMADSQKSIRKQKTGGSLLEVLEEIATANNVAFGVRFNAQIPRMEFWARPGVNRSIRQNGNEPVFFSTELDDVLSSEYSYDSGEYRNVALVAGEGEGGERAYVTVNGANSGMGFSRRELFVDARDLQSENVESGETMTPEEYAAMLSTRGTEKLAENPLSQSFEATVRVVSPTYEYGVDFFLGDTITITDERLGVTVDAVVTAVQRSVSQSGESMTLTFGYGQPTVYETLKRKAGK